MIKTIILSLCLAASSLSLNARAQDVRQYSEGPVTEVDYIQVEYGRCEEYIDWLNSTWKPTMEAFKKAGLAHIASGPERNKGWLRAIFDPQIGAALSAIHDRVNTPWTVESLAEAAGMSRSAFAARFKELLGQTPLEYVTLWRMQKAIQLLERRDKKLPEVARLVGYESDAAFSKAFKRVVRANPGEYLKRGLKDPKSTEADPSQSR
jgi:AraC-like DNA-binding protein